MWGKKEQKEENQSRPGGIDFDTAAERVTAEVEEPDEHELAVDEDIAAVLAGKPDEEALIVKPKWALRVSKGCFYPAARWIHPAYSLNDQEAEKINPEMQAFLQAAVDKYMPAAVSRVASRFPEMWDLLAVLGVLYYQKYQVVKKLIAEEAKAAENAKRVAGSHIAVMPAPQAEEPEEKIVGQRLRDGTLV